MSVLLVTSNGFGMGHLTRLLSVALAGDDRLAPTIISMSVALPLAREQGVPAEYLPGIVRGWMSGSRWHRYVRDRLVALTRELAAEVVVFDGVVPYPGIGMARHRMPEVAFVWMRRGMWVPGGNDVQLAKSGVFDLIIEPGDLASAADRGPTADRDDALRIPPLSLLEVVRPLPRAEAATALGLDPDRPTVLVTLGHGEITEPGRVVVSTLLEDPEWQIAVTRVAIAGQHVPIVDRDRIVELEGVYPLVRYLSAFDAVVSAAGYNAVHEFLPAGLPTLLVPDPGTRTDDQVGRAEHLARTGHALTARLDDADGLATQVRRLGDPTVRAALVDRLVRDGSGRLGGVAAATDAIVDLAHRFQPRPRSRGESLRRARERTKESLKDALGATGANAVRRLLGRDPIGRPSGRLAVRVVADAADLGNEPEGPTPLLLSDRIPPGVIRTGSPVEDILPGSSSAYRAERRRIVDTYFDVTGWPEPASGEPG